MRLARHGAIVSGEICPHPGSLSTGGGTDLAARLIAQKLTESLGKPVLVENRAGANGNIGTDAMAKAAADGYTLGMATPGPVTAGKSRIRTCRTIPSAISRR